MDNFSTSASPELLHAERSSLSKGLPGVGMLRKADRDNHNGSLVALDPMDARARPFTLLRTQLIKRLSEKNAQLIGITSAAPGAGKSFTASNLAVSIAQLPNKKVYLVDLDLRRATLASIFGIECKFGMTEYLAGDNVRLEDIGQEIGDDGLILYPSIPAPVNSASLMGGEKFKALIAAARALPEDAVVIFDLPPAFANDDAAIAAQQMDGFLMLVEQGVTSQKQLRSALQMLHPTPCFGTVLNRFNGGFGDPYGYGGKYDSYYSS
jgi:protein-tyrosine kinase